MRSTPLSISASDGRISLFGPHMASGLAVYRHSHDHRPDALGQPVPIDSGAPEEPRASGGRRCCWWCRS